jgi:hypothetical protein
LGAIQRFVSAAVFIPDRRIQKKLRGDMNEISQRGLLAYNTPQSYASSRWNDPDDSIMLYFEDH